jgi:hypothetical protein
MNIRVIKKKRQNQSMIELEFRNVDFCGGRKTGEPVEKPLKQGRESTTKSTYI